MKAIVCTAYGPPDVLQLREVEQPVPKRNEVRIRVHATAVTASDCILRAFRLRRRSIMGFMMGLMVGFSAPRKPILGMVFAGEIESTGKDAKRFTKGNRVFGSTLAGPGIRFGAYAEYMCLPENGLIELIPSGITYEEAAAIPYGAGLALFVLKKAGIKSGQNALIYGASGAIGTAAVQLAKYFGARVTGACSTSNLELVKSLGADAVLDYTAADLPDVGGPYDLIVDAVGRAKSSEFKLRCRNALAPNGVYISVDDGSPKNSPEDYALFRELLEARKLRPIIDRCYPLDQMADAHRYVDQGHKKGNVVITVE
ncbi:MAG: NAD(P)-dependent alcohol dehydrogenase [Anaerolineae bacterium]